MNNIKNLRSKKGITQQQLSEILKVDKSTISKWETYNSNPRVDTLTKLASIFGCTLDELLKTN